jgi:hypothetical protein
LKESDLTKLVRILGMLGSDHPGERATAALAAHRLVQSKRANWYDLLKPSGSGDKGGAIVRTVYEWGIDHAKAAEARMRQIRAENEQLHREVSQLRNRLGIKNTGRAV